MAVQESTPGSIRFGDYHLDVPSLELRKHGMRVRLRQQAMRVLALLAQRPGKVVTREELQRELWKDDTFVDFEGGLNNCIKQIREALNDDAEHPTYVETLVRLGYRFVAPVQVAAGSGNRAANRAAGQAVVTASPELAARAVRLRPLWIWVGAGALLIAATALWMLVGRAAFSFHERDSVLVTDFENHTGDPRFNDALRTAFTVSLEQSRYANLVPRGRIDAALKRMGKSDEERVTREVGKEICQREGVRGLITASITRTGNEYALTAELIDPISDVPVRSYSERIHGEDHILDALDTIAARIRADLGESLYRIHQANRPLPQVTTASLGALKEYVDGQTLWQQAKYDDAMALFRSALAADADFAMVHAALGSANCSHVYNQRELCVQEYQKALALSSRTTDRERRLIEANYASDAGHIDDAGRLFRLYLTDYPDDWQARSSYSRLLRTHGSEAEAIQEYQQLLRIAPNDARTYVQIATAYKALEKPAEAVRAYSEAFRVDPEMLDVTNINREYGFTLVANGEEPKAEQVFWAQASDPKTRGSALDSLALLDLMHGRYAKAKRELAEALSLAVQPSSALTRARNHFFLAVVAEGEGNKIRQIDELDEALSEFSALGVKVQYGSLVGAEYARAGSITKATKVAELITPLADSHSDEQAGYLRVLQGEIALAKGDAAGAAKLFALQNPAHGREAAALSVEALGRAYQAMGDTDAAISSHQKLVSGGCQRLTGWEPQQRCPEARVALAGDYLARGDKQKALAALAPLLKDWQDADANLPLKKQALGLQSQISN